MQKPGSSGVGEHEQPVMASRRRRPFLLPRFCVAEEIDFAQAARESFLRGEVREELERRAGMELAVVPGLEQEETVVIERAIRDSDPAAARREEQQAQPAALRGALGEQRVELLHGRVGANRRTLLVLPPGGLEPPRIGAAA